MTGIKTVPFEYNNIGYNAGIDAVAAGQLIDQSMDDIDCVL